MTFILLVLHKRRKQINKIGKDQGIISLSFSLYFILGFCLLLSPFTNSMLFGWSSMIMLGEVKKTINSNQLYCIVVMRLSSDFIFSLFFSFLLSKRHRASEFQREREKEITPIIQRIFVHWSSHEGDPCLDLKEYVCSCTLSQPNNI